MTGETSNNAAAETKLHPIYTVSNIQHKVRILDGSKVTYSAWVKLFQLHARGYRVVHHIDGTPPPAKTDQTYAHWAKINAHVLQWIYGTVSDDHDLTRECICFFSCTSFRLI